MLKYSDVLSKYATNQISIVPSLRKCGFVKKADSIQNCAEYIQYSVCTECYTGYMSGVNSCKDRFCPICQKKRSMLYFAKFVPKLHDLLIKGYYVNLLTFTITDIPDLKKSIEVIKKAFRLLQHNNIEYRKEFNSRFVGGISSLETKIGENSKLWHTHLHCIVIKKEFSRDFQFLMDSWNKCVQVSGGEHSSTDVTNFGSVDIKSIIDKRNVCTNKIVSVENGCLETLKYITKFDYEVNIDKLPELIYGLSKVRSINTWGILRGITSGIEKDMDKDFKSIFNCVCKVCGNDQFFEFFSSRKFKNILDFDMNDTIVTKELKDFGTGYALLRPDLEVGQTYGGIMFTQFHDLLRKFGKYIPIGYEDKHYVFKRHVFETYFQTISIYVDEELYKVQDSIKKIVPEQYRFSKEMFLEFSKDLPPNEEDIRDDVIPYKLIDNESELKETNSLFDKK